MFLNIDVPEALRLLQGIARKRKGVFNKDIIRVVADSCGLHERYPYKGTEGSRAVPEEQKGRVLDTLAHLGFKVPHLLDEMSDVLRQHAQTLADGTVELA